MTKQRENKMQLQTVTATKSNRSMSDTESQFESFRSAPQSPVYTHHLESVTEMSNCPVKEVTVGQAGFVEVGVGGVRGERRESRSVMSNCMMREEVTVGQAGFMEGIFGGGGRHGSVIEVGAGGERRSKPVAAAVITRRLWKDVVRRVELGIRIGEVIACLISFWVMEADKSRGWSGDSFDRYKEFRYCAAMTVIGLVYSGLQACNLAYNLVTGKHKILHHLRCYFDFAMDQIVAYLLISASSSAATRVDDWASNWGEDLFTEMASVSVVMSFLAFFAFAISSLISGYTLCSVSQSSH